jgi:hypothetical protein
MITQDFKTKWTQAINKCLKQKSYGKTDTCTLCLTAKHCCKKCICSIAPLNGSCDDPFYACEDRIAHFSESDVCRAELREMLAWINRQEVKGAKK